MRTGVGRSGYRATFGPPGGDALGNVSGGATEPATLGRSDSVTTSVTSSVSTVSTGGGGGSNGSRATDVDAACGNSRCGAAFRSCEIHHAMTTINAPAAIAAAVTREREGRATGTT